VRQVANNSGGTLAAAAAGTPAALTVVQLHHLLHAHIVEVGRGARGCTRERGRERAAGGHFCQEQWGGG